MSEKNKTFIYPAPSDPRWLILIFLMSFVVYALNTPGFSRQPSQFAASLITCVGLDAVLIYFYKGLLLAPLSGLVTSLGTLLLCDSPAIWPYALVGALSISSKHFIRIERKHIFNPNNFGVVAAMLLFREDITIVAGRWGGSLTGMALIASLGIAVARKAGRLDLSIAYVASFLAGSLIRNITSGIPLSVILNPITGASFALFIFFMITDPMTTPENSKNRVFFGITLGLTDSFLRHWKIQNAPFYSLFLLHSLLPLWEQSEFLHFRKNDKKILHY